MIRVNGELFLLKRVPIENFQAEEAADSYALFIPHDRMLSTLRLVRDGYEWKDNDAV